MRRLQISAFLCYEAWVRACVTELTEIPTLETVAQTYVYTIQATKDKQDSFLDVKTITPAFKVPVNEPLSASYWLAKSFQDASVLLVFLCV